MLWRIRSSANTMLQTVRVFPYPNISTTVQRDEGETRVRTKYERKKNWIKMLVKFHVNWSFRLPDLQLKWKGLDSFS